MRAGFLTAFVKIKFEGIGTHKGKTAELIKKLNQCTLKKISYDTSDIKPDAGDDLMRKAIPGG